MGKKNRGQGSPTFEAIKHKNEQEKIKDEDRAQFHLMAPFGPSIGMVQLPKSILDNLLKATDKILLDKNRIDWGTNLVGQINEEPWVSNKVLEEIGVMEPLRTCIQQYTIAMLQRQGIDQEMIREVGVHLDHMWIVSQYENEYNPIHYHTYCDLSAVLYLKVPDFKNRVEEKELPSYKNNKDGQIELVYKSADANTCERGTLLIDPKPGMLLLFPSNLLHTVYPFKGDGERRSVAFNSQWSAIKHDGSPLDKSVRIPTDQDHEKYREKLRSKGEVSRYAIEDNK
tara:strand:+ start:4712 stop:5563 length:852 start_codon:yes stop_codon:yes gene_type:complete